MNESHEPTDWGGYSPPPISSHSTSGAPPGGAPPSDPRLDSGSPTDGCAAPRAHVVVLRNDVVARADRLEALADALRDELAEVEWDALSDDEAARFAVVIERIGRHVDGGRVRVAATIGDRCARERGSDGMAYRHGERTARGLLEVLTGVSAATARRRLRTGDLIFPSPTLTGGDVPAVFPRVGAALGSGLIGFDVAEVIVRALADAARRADPAELGEVVEHLVTAATDPLDESATHGATTGIGLCADLIGVRAQVFATALDQDGAEPEDDTQQRRRGFTLSSRTDADGMTKITGWLTPEQAATVRACLAPFTGPRAKPAFLPEPGGDEGGDQEAASEREGAADERAGVRDAGEAASSEAATTPAAATATAAAAVGVVAQADDPIGATEPVSPFRAATAPNSETEPRDPRTHPQRTVDILVALIKAGAASESTVGASPELVVFVSADTLGARFGAAPGAGGRAGAPFGMSSPSLVDESPAHGSVRPPIGWVDQVDSPLPRRALERMLCAGSLAVAVTGRHGELDALGRPTRLFTPAQKRALAARDGGCAWGTCSAPPSWTEAHHVEFHGHGGATSVENGVLLCSFHHHVVHKGEWSVTMRRGVPYLTAPRWIDPTRTPRPMGRQRGTMAA